MLYFLVQQVQTTQNTGSRAANDIVNCDVADNELTMDAFEEDLFNRVNNYREDNGLDLLTKSPSLIQATAWKTADGTGISHTDSLGRNSAERAYDCGYRGNVSENNAQANSSSHAFQMWQSSTKGHSENMLNPDHAVAGVGRQGSIWVMKFGSQLESDGNFSPSPTREVANQPTAQPTSAPSAGITPAPGEVVLQVRVQISGVGGRVNTKPARSALPVEVTVYDVENREVVSKDVQVQFDGQEYYTGYFRANGIEEGRYVVQIRGPHTLRKTVEPYLHHLVPGEINALPVTALVVGDFDGDNVLSFADVIVLASCTQNSNCTRREDVDLNFDGRVDVLDYNLMLQAFVKVEGD